MSQSERQNFYTINHFFQVSSIKADLPFSSIVISILSLINIYYTFLMNQQIDCQERQNYQFRLENPAVIGIDLRNDKDYTIWVN
ncbi:unnamed protein product (macronuclear) [Paramecium tetraurelia]|uniref:Uncharacterized protein n=1 Tax=Paramecium tetraurelia TaxID=5888 RepID=A0CPX9_PARTE|nr:uncharacterized protein GSPATT00038803001 [Paramecium tetraurelia]CAK72846.1 unnamed protein product [Paramecium tetraurelia]|eukprot:XP_001440243.1 hypothetical protein (macronuclear) [Paramecium tetraurelia strain d4-2]